MKTLLMTLGALTLACAFSRQVEVGRETSDTRTVADILGETEIPAAPQRIVVTFPEFAEYLGVLGVNVSGVTTCGPHLELPFFAPPVADAARVGQLPPNPRRRGRAPRHEGRSGGVSGRV